MRIKFETLRSLDPEALDIDNHMSQHSIHHFQSPHMNNSMHHNNHTQQHHHPVDAIILKTEVQQPVQQPQQHHSHPQMEIDVSNIKVEQTQGMTITPEIVTIMSTGGQMGKYTLQGGHIYLYINSLKYV